MVVMVVVVGEGDDVVEVVEVGLEVVGEVPVVMVCVGEEGTVEVAEDVDCGVVVGDSSVDVPPKHPLASTSPTINNATSILKLFSYTCLLKNPQRKESGFRESMETYAQEL